MNTLEVIATASRFANTAVGWANPIPRQVRAKPGLAVVILSQEGVDIYSTPYFLVRDDGSVTVSAVPTAEFDGLETVWTEAQGGPYS